MAAVERDLHAEAEARLGRKLFAGEKNRDILAIDSILENGKERLRQAIEIEKRRAIRKTMSVWRRGGFPHAALHVTDEMMSAIVSLYDAGRHHAQAELALIGVEVRKFARDEPAVDPVAWKLATFLGGISVRIDQEIFGADAEDLVSLSLAGMTREIDRLVPGALDAASRLVSQAFDAGMGDVFAAHDELIGGGWVYSAMMDAGTCDECSALDGSEYASWAEIQVALPNGGPNPNCFGNGRCRCMAVPAA